MKKEVRMREKCGVCGGSGELIGKECNNCRGKGHLYMWTDIGILKTVLKTAKELPDQEPGSGIIK